MIPPDNRRTDMTDFQIGDSVNETALGEFTVLLREAYENGARNDATMDWDDVQKAHAKAVEAFGEDGAAFVAAAGEGFEMEPRVTYPSDTAWETRSAAQLLFAYRYPEDVQWEDVDLSWDILLQADVERGAKPVR
jgi:hypothetical protein